MEQMMETPAAPPRRGWAKRALRALLWAALVVVVLAALVVAMVLWVNRRDEAPSADVRALQAVLAQARPVPAADDAYAGLAALSAARDPKIDGLQPAAQVAAAQRYGDDLRARRGEAVDAAYRACDAPDGECAELLAAAEPSMAAWIERERDLLAAYRGVLGRRGWYEPPPPSDPMEWTPTISAAGIEGQRLHLAQALLDARAGRSEAVRGTLDADARFWRSALAGSRTLIGKMTAAVAIRRNFDMGAHALARLPADAIDAAVPAAWVEPFTAAERTLLPALAWEWQFGDNTTRKVYADANGEMRRRDAGAPSLNPLLKVQATSNRSAARLRRIAEAYDVPYPQLRGALERLGEDIERDTRYPVQLYNPIGSILGAIAAPAYVDYGKRIADLEGQRRAVLAVIDLHRNAVMAAAVPAALAASPSRDPYTGRPFEWDASSSCVRALGLDRTFGRRCLHYAPAPPAAHDTPDA